MCGIFGAISLAQGPLRDEEVKDFERSLSIISYRGPDDQSSKLLNDRRVFLGHRRLSIIDLSVAANQPMEADGIWIAYNGEIFNYLEIKAELVKKGHSFTTSSDTEVILKTYIEYGPSGFDKFNGMWAILLFDSKKNTFLASRDRFSIKPLYYLQEPGRVYFASEIKQLIPYLGTPTPNVSMIKTFLAQQIQDFNLETFFQNIFKIPPKCTMEIDLNTGKQQIFQYWDYNKLSLSKQENVFEEFVHLFEESIKLRLRSDVSIGCLLSGGLDSTAIAITADKLNQNPVETFSIISNDPAYSEEKFIDIAVRSAGLKNRKLSFLPQAVDRHIDKTLFHQDEPFAGASVVAQYMIYELIKKETGIKVVLSGQGGDEVLMGYLKYFFFNVKQNLHDRNYFTALAEVFASFVKRTAIMQFQWSSAKRYAQFLNGKKKSLITLNDSELEKIWEVKSINHRQKLDLDSYSVPPLTHFEDRNSMAHSIESRVPFLDHHLVNFLVNIRTDLKYKHGWSKYLLRNSRINLPDQIRWRRDKKGFTVPEKAWLYSLKAQSINANNYKRLYDLNILEKKDLGQRLNEFFSGSRFIDPKEIFALYVTNKWLNQNFD